MRAAVALTLVWLTSGCQAAPGPSDDTDVLATDDTDDADGTIPDPDTEIETDETDPRETDASETDDTDPQHTDLTDETDADETGETDTDTVHTDSDFAADTDTPVPSVALRFTDLDLRDPHLFAAIGVCADVTATALNTLLASQIRSDGDGDGRLDLSVVQVFRPLDTRHGATGSLDLTFPDCTLPFASTACELPQGAWQIAATATSATTGACLEPIAGTTTGSYTPAIAPPTAVGGAACYAADLGTVTLSLAGIPITLRDTRIGGEWTGMPADAIVDGLLVGFLTESDATSSTVPATIPIIGGAPLASLLSGGVGSCRQPSPALGDKDTLPDGTVGWYVHLAFAAVQVPYVAP